MTTARLRLLGSPELCNADTKKNVRFAYSKLILLLAYLALEHKAHTREALADLFWAGLAEEDARATNVARYPEFQAYFKQYRPPILAVWEKNDPFFLPQGALAFQRDNPAAEVHFYDTGHFAPETHVIEISQEIHRFLDKNIANP